MEKYKSLELLENVVTDELRTDQVNVEIKNQKLILYFDNITDNIFKLRFEFFFQNNEVNREIEHILLSYYEKDDKSVSVDLETASMHESQEYQQHTKENFLEQEKDLSELANSIYEFEPSAEVAKSKSKTVVAVTTLVAVIMAIYIGWPRNTLFLLTSGSAYNITGDTKFHSFLDQSLINLNTKFVYCDKMTFFKNNGHLYSINDKLEVVQLPFTVDKFDFVVKTGSNFVFISSKSDFTVVAGDLRGILKMFTLSKVLYLTAAAGVDEENVIIADDYYNLVAINLNSQITTFTYVGHFSKVTQIKLIGEELMVSSESQRSLVFWDLKKNDMIRRLNFSKSNDICFIGTKAVIVYSNNVRTFDLLTNQEEKVDFIKGDVKLEKCLTKKDLVLLFNYDETLYKYSLEREGVESVGIWKDVIGFI